MSGAYDYSVRVWDAATGHCTHVLAGHGNRVYSLQFDPERNLVISGSLDTTIRVWDISGSSGESRHILTGHKSLNSDMQLRGNILVSGNADMTVKVWDIGSGQCLHTMDGPHKHQSAVTCLQFLKNGLIVSSSDDGTVKLWDSANGQFVRDLIRLETGSGSGATGPAASGSQSGGGVVWRLKATDTKLICAVGSRSGIEPTRLLVLDFDVQAELE